MIIYKNVQKSYGDREIIRDVNFTVEQGEFVVMIGPSGCGKTTTVKMLNRLIEPSGGQILINGTDNREMDLVKLRTSIGYVIQQIGLFPNMTVEENISVVPKIMKWDKERTKKRVRELMDIVNMPYEEYGKKYPKQLSGGQLQRVAFARALAPNPQVLLLDEPFAAIDAKVRTELRTWLKEMVEKLGITSIFVTHDQDEAVEVADEIIITNHGQIEQLGSPMEIYKTPATPFVAQFIGRSTVVEDYEKLKGFDRVPGADRAVIRPEFVKISKSGRLDQYQSAAESGIVKDVLFRGSHLDVTVDVNGVEIVAERSMEKDVVKPGEQVHVLIYRLYVFDENQTYLLENKAMQDNDVFYI